MALVSAADGERQLALLAAGLWFVSESDRPLTVVRFEAYADDELPSALAAVSERRGALVERVALAEFFARATEPQPWHSPEEVAIVERYRALVTFLARELTGARVYRVGTVDVNAYALGRTREGEWLGVATILVET